MSGLSLRTIQRAEAGHRVSYASLWSLAITLEMDVDELERELYAMKESKEDFVEVPRWVRILTDGRWMGLPRISRYQAHVVEGISMGVGILFLAVSFVVAREESVSMLRSLAWTSLVCGYLMSVTTRITDAYKAWPALETAPPAEQAARTRRSNMALYVFEAFLLLLILTSVFLQEK